MHTGDSSSIGKKTKRCIHYAKYSTGIFGTNKFSFFHARIIENSTSFINWPVWFKFKKSNTFLFFNTVSAWRPSSKRGQDDFKPLFYFYLRQWLTISRYWDFIYIFDPSCLKYITLFFCLSIRFWQPFWEAILNFMVKTVLKHKKYPSIRLLTSELATNYTSFVSMTIWF